MPDTNGHKPMPFVCEHCDFLLFMRRGNTADAYGFQVLFKKSQPIKCKRCGRHTKFKVDSRGETV